MLKLSMCGASLLLSSAALASFQTNDHTGGGGDPREIARASYRAADDAEALGHSASFSCRSNGAYQLAASAQRMHLALSNLYRAAMRASNGQMNRDHNGSPLGQYFEVVEQSYYQVQNDYSNTGFSCGGDVQRLYQGLQYDYSVLERDFGSAPVGEPGGQNG